MNIAQAIGQLESTVRAYTACRNDGTPAVPVSSQRPVYLIGPPGVGKTEIVAQVAQRMNVGLAAYTMTHHTRQSALGLPALVKRSFAGQEYTVTEYTMSEIVASVYRRQEALGCSAGILFLDEINCVSETLTPAMLELLQHKRFGQHPLPDGWMIVCAGNPEQYNRSAHEFDPVTLDRVRVIRIEPDVSAWLDYAAGRNVHPSVRAYLRLRPEDFYQADGEGIVTARSWVDLSDMMLALESLGEPVDGLLFAQYLQCPAIAESFSLYYALCRRISDRFQLTPESDWEALFADAPFDQALFARTLIEDRRRSLAAEQALQRRLSMRLQHFIDGVNREIADPADFPRVAREHLERTQRALDVRRQAGALSPDQEREEILLRQKILSTLSRPDAPSK